MKPNDNVVLLQMKKHPSLPLDKLESLTKRLDETNDIYLSKVTELTGFMLCHPFACWVKDTEGRMMFVNGSYERDFGIAPQMYSGTIDSKVWNERESSMFKRNDKKVISSGKPERFYEKIFNNKKGLFQRLTVYKWPIRVGGKIIGVGGQVVDSVDETSK